MKILSIHDLAGFGRSSLTTIISAFSGLGHQCVALPTAVFSTHTAISDFVCQDLTNFAKGALSHYEKLAVNFDAIYSGYLCSCEQIDMVKSSFDMFPNAIKIVDPVMADNGKIYKSYTKEMCDGIIQLVKSADIITPNITECKVILGMPLDTQITSTDEIVMLLKSLSSLGPKRVVITGIAMENELVTAFFDDGVIGFCSTEYIDCYFPGTGDLFATLLISKLLHGESLELAVKFSTEFISRAIIKTIKSGSNPIFGVEFEGML